MIYFSIGLTILISIMVVFTTSTAQAPQPATRPEVDLGEPGLSYRYVQSYGETDVPYFADPDYLNDPIGIYGDGNDNLYVTEEMGFRVLEFDPSATISLTLGIAGHPAWMFGGDGKLFNSPHDVALDDSGNIWVTDENRVAAFDSNGGFQQQLVESPFSRYVIKVPLEPTTGIPHPPPPRRRGTPNSRTR